MPETRIGISGWRYEPWQGTFYPPKLPQDKELWFASRCLNSIELNGSFYSLQRPSSYQNWYDDTPDDFLFAVKGGRFITHMKRLKEVDQPIAIFFAQGILLLKEKLGPILWQLPPNFVYNQETIARFLDLLPHDTTAAAKLAKNHGKKIDKSRMWTETDTRRPVRHAIEVRHESFQNDEFVRMLRDHNVALVIAETAGRFPYMEDITAADFIYVRMHGDEELYVSGYSEEALDRWAKRLKLWQRGAEPADARRVAPKAKANSRPRDAYIYFDNDVKVRSPIDAMALAGRFGIESKYEQLKKEAAASSGRPKRKQVKARPKWGK